MSLKRADRTLQTLWRTAVPHNPEEVSLLENGYGDGPSDELEIRPPRLQDTTSCASWFKTRNVLVCLLVLYSATLTLQTVRRPQTSAFASLADFFAPEPVAPTPALIKRLRLIKRASAPFHGADRESLRRTFPHWFRENHPDFTNFFFDAALALHILASQNDGSSAQKRELLEENRRAAR